MKLKRKKSVAPVREYREPWQFEALREATDKIREVWTMHSEVNIGGSFGTGGLGHVFWCKSCSQPWPCKTARLVIDWGQLTPLGEWKPLKLEREELAARG